MKTASCLFVLTLMTSSAVAGDWIISRSFYTHDPQTGHRTHQFARPPETIVPVDPSLRSSGFSHFRSSINFGQSADNYHRVTQWGDPVRPYGEWRFPFRPYSVPYQWWGEPYGGLQLGGVNAAAGPWVSPPWGGWPGGGNVPPNPPGNPGPGGPGGMGPGNAIPGPPGNWQPGPGAPWQWGFPWPGGPNPGSSQVPYPSGPNQPYPVPPYADGYYPDYGSQPRLPDRQFFEKPTM